MTRLLLVAGLACLLAACATAPITSPALASGSDSDGDDMGLGLPPAGYTPPVPPAEWAARERAVPVAYPSDEIPPPPAELPLIGEGEEAPLPPAGEAPAMPVPGEGEIVSEEPVIIDGEIVEGDIVEEVVPIEPAPPEAYSGRTISQNPGCNVCRRNPCGCGKETYITASFEIVPGLGGGILMGREISRSRGHTWSFEFGFSHQDLTSVFDNENFAGNWWTGKLGLRLAPTRGNSRLRPYFRAGVALMEASGQPQMIDLDIVDIPAPGTYLGAYAGAGFDIRLSRNFSTGPEAQFFWGENLTNGVSSANVPVFRWNFTWDL